MPTADEVFESLKPVMDPEFPVSITDPRVKIVELDFIRVLDDIIRVRFKPTTPYCPMGGLIGVLIKYRLEEVYPEKKIQVLLIPNSHQQEEAVNSMINDDEKYQNVVQQLKERGMV